MVLRSKTLFVLGAGASKEIGLPTGYELKHKLASRLNIRFPDGWVQSSGDKEITEALRTVVRVDGREGDINPYLHKAWQMVGALPQAISIDNYIDALEDSQVALLGKLAIVREIIQSEKDSALFFKEDDGRPAALRRLEQTHYHGLFQLLSEGLRRSSVDEFFTNATFISFNYDRSIEWYFYQAIQNFFGIDAEKAVSVMSGLRVIHPYGTVGALPIGRPSSELVPYGGGYRHNYIELASAIRTFTEQINSQSISDSIEIEVMSATRMVFLGFGFHEINMQTLGTSKKTSLRQVFGTALGVSKSDIEAITDSVVMNFSSPLSNPTFNQMRSVDLRSDLKCNDIFLEYARSLRA